MRTKVLITAAISKSNEELLVKFLETISVFFELIGFIMKTNWIQNYFYSKIELTPLKLS